MANDALFNVLPVNLQSSNYKRLWDLKLLESFLSKMHLLSSAAVGTPYFWFWYILLRLGKFDGTYIYEKMN